MKNAVITTLLVLTTHLALGQISQYTPMTDPPSPTAYEFMKYGDVPISKYTGVPDISIPLCTVKEGTIEVPIVLRYHAGGIRVDQEASCVGLGWSLTTGGQITQIVNGYDDYGTKPLYVPYLLNDNFNYCELGVAHQDVLPNDLQFNQLNGGKRSVINSINHNAQPDIFNYSFMGYTGKFIIPDNVQKIPVNLSDENVKIELLVDDPSCTHCPNFGYKITTPEGYVGHFAEVETSMIQYTATNRIRMSDFNNQSFTGSTLSTSDGTRASQNFYLTKIESPNSTRDLNLDYLATSNELVNLPVQSHTADFNDYSAQGCIQDESGLYITETHTRQRYKYLDEITFANGRGSVEFFHSDRIDHIGTKKVDKIEVRYDNELVKTIVFDYSYFEADSNNSRNYYNRLLYGHSPKTTNELTKRLKLNSVSINGDQVYSFSYNVQQLPNKTSMATDYWGLYNGSSNNKTFLPNIRRFNRELGDSRFDVVATNNKSSSEPYAKACILEKITYPTGGTSEFDFELNTFGNYNVPDYDYNGYSGEQIVLRDENNDSAPLSDEYAVINFDGGTDRSVEFNITGRLFLYYPGTTTITSCYHGGDVGQAEIIEFPASYKDIFENTYAGSTNAFIAAWVDGQFGNVGSYVNIIVPTSGDPDFHEYTQAIQSVELSPTKLYVVRAVFPDHCSSHGSSGGYLEIRYSDVNVDLPPINQGYSTGAGLRVKSVSNKDGNDILKIKNYSYENGKHMSPLDFLQYSTKTYIGAGANNCYLSVFTRKISSSSFYSQASNTANVTFGYDRVIEDNKVYDIHGNFIEDNGSIVEEFQNNQDRILLNYHGINMPTIPDDIENGAITKRTLYDDTSEKVREETFQYAYNEDEQDCYYGVQFGRYEFNSAVIFGLGTVSDKYEVVYYPITFHKNVTLQEQKVDFYEDGAITETTTYEYTPNLLPKRIITDNSETNTSLTSEHFYSFETEVSGNPHMTHLNDANRIIEPIKTNHYKNGDLLVTETLDYDVFETSGATLVAPSQQWGQKTNLEQIEYWRIENRDSQGNVLQFKTIDGTPMALVWGYEKQYLVATVRNADYDAIQAIPGINFSQINNPSSDQALRTELDKIRQALPHAQVTSYTHDPLIGMSSITDPRGYTMYYEYDADNRLEYIKDQNEKIYSKYEYNFKTNN